MSETDFKPHTAQVTQMWIDGSPQVRKTLEDAHAHYERVFQPLEDERAQPEGIAAMIHRKIDAQVRELMRLPGSRSVSCKKGCGACCHLVVRITAEEARLLRSWCASKGIWIDEGRLDRQAAASASVDAWAELPHADKRCVFLTKAETCGVYEHRPAACRKYMVKNDPADCDTEKRPGARTKIYVAWQAEVIYSASLAVFDSDPMAVALIKQRGET